MIRILLVEDNVDDADLAVTALKDYCPADNIVTVSDGAQALDYLHGRRHFAGRELVNPILVLLDIKMPKVDGLEVLRAIKNNERLKTVPVVILTSSREERDIADSYRLGCNAYVVKPLVFTKFMDEVGKLAAFWLTVNMTPSAGVAAHGTV